MQEHTNTLKIGTVLLEKYRIDKVLGEGGFGVVYYALDTVLDRYVALKECIPCDFAHRKINTTEVIAKTQSSLGDFELAKSQFVKEARTLGKFKNDNLLSANNIFETNGTVYMDSDFIEGKTLEDLSTKESNQEEILNVFRGILNGLRDVHAVGLMHRDIKPDNIIITKNNKVPVLIDFGSARMAARSKTTPLPTMLSQGYAPLEQYFEDGNQGPWTDIYALASVCYKMITGSKPPDAASRVKTDSIVILSENYKNKYNNRLLKLLDKCLLMDEEKRPQSVDEILLALRNIDEDSFASPNSRATQIIRRDATTHINKSRQKQKKSNSKAWLIAASAFTIVVIAAIGYIKYNEIKLEEIQVAELQTETNAKADETRFAKVETAKQSKLEEIRIAKEANEYWRLGKALHSGENSSSAIDKLKKAAQLGHAEAQFELANCYCNGFILEKNYNEAIKLYKKSAEQGHTKAQFNLATCYYLGLGTNKNYTAAAKWYEKAADNGYAEAQAALANCYETGNGVNKNYNEAIKNYLKSATQNNTKAQLALANCYYLGLGVDKNYTEAFNWYKKAAEQNNAEAQFNLAKCYESGIGIAKNKTEAVDWYKKSAKNGYSLAKNALQKATP